MRPNAVMDLSRRIARRVVPARLRTLFSGILWSLQYRGSAVSCPCCGSCYRKFAPFGLDLRENAMCHNCGALERHRSLWVYVTRELHLFNQPLRLLHFAPEPVLYRKFSESEDIDYHPCDLAPQDLTAGVRKMDITDIQFDDESFDAIICNHVLEHVPDDHEAMSELHRVLQKDGWAVFQVPISSHLDHTVEDLAVTDPDQRRKLYGQSDHVRRYGKDFEKRLERTGFNVRVEEIERLFSPRETSRFGLMAGDVIFFCTKGDTTVL